MENSNIEIARTKKTMVTTSAVALALKEVARIRQRPDGYSLEIVKAVKLAINEDKEHHLRTLVETLINHERVPVDNSEPKRVKCNANNGLMCSGSSHGAYSASTKLNYFRPSIFEG